MVRKYSRAVAGNDDNFKRVLDYLNAEGELDNTIVVYMSDQGYWLGQHGFYDKRLILETSVKTPFVIRYPKLIKAGGVNTDVVMNIDIAPTLLDMVVTVDAMEGSFLPMLKGEPAIGVPKPSTPMTRGRTCIRRALYLLNVPGSTGIV